MDPQEFARLAEQPGTKESILQECSRDPVKALRLFQSMEQVVDARVQYRSGQLQSRVDGLEQQIKTLQSDFILVETLNPDRVELVRHLIRKSDIQSVAEGRDGISRITVNGEVWNVVTAFKDVMEALGYYEGNKEGGGLPG